MTLIFWEEREGPLLLALAELENEPREYGILDLVEAGRRAQLDQETTRVIAGYLLDAHYVTGNGVRSGGMPGYAVVVLEGLTEKGRVRVGTWPDPTAGQFDAFVSALRQLADAESDPAAKSKLDVAIEAVTAVGTGTITGVLVGLGRAHGIG